MLNINSDINSIESLIDSMSVNMEVYFDFKGKHWAIEPDPTTHKTGEDWLVYSLDKPDNIVHLKTINDVLSYKLIDGITLKEAWPQATNKDF